MENEIIRSKQYNVAKLRNILYIISIIITVFWQIIYTIPAHMRHVYYYRGYGFDTFFYVFHIMVPLLPLVVIGTLIYVITSKIELIVTDKRVYGTAIFSKRVDLPLDMISAVGTSAFKGIAVTTSSGAIKFVFVKNCDEIHKEISKLLLKRQTEKKPAQEIKQEVIQQSSADELKKFKDLLDQGIISQEEFDAKKKQLLGL